MNGSDITFLAKPWLRAVFFSAIAAARPRARGTCKWTLHSPSDISWRLSRSSSPLFLLWDFIVLTAQGFTLQVPVIFSIVFRSFLPCIWFLVLLSLKDCRSPSLHLYQVDSYTALEPANQFVNYGHLLYSHDLATLCLNRWSLALIIFSAYSPLSQNEDRAMITLPGSISQENNQRHSAAH